jgi:hypothetical protein
LLLLPAMPPALLAAILLPILLRYALLHALLCTGPMQLLRALSGNPLWGGLMSPRQFGFFLAAATLLIVTAAGSADAARLRYHYTAVDERGTTILRPISNGAPGERLTWSLRWEPYTCPPPRATRMVTFTHPCAHRTLTLPLSLPPDVPRMEYRSDRVIYNYGSDTVEIHFQSDGSSDVIYNSGFRRPR